MLATLSHDCDIKHTVWREIFVGANFRYFRGWLGSHEIFPPTKINVHVLCESMMMGVATNIEAAWPTLSSVSKQQ